MIQQNKVFYGPFDDVGYDKHAQAQGCDAVQGIHVVHKKMTDSQFKMSVSTSLGCPTVKLPVGIASGDPEASGAFRVFPQSQDASEI